MINLRHHILKPETEWHDVDYGEVIDLYRHRAGKAESIQELNEYFHEILRLKRGMRFKNYFVWMRDTPFI